MPDHQHKPTRALLRIPLLRLLAINLAIGACAAALLVGGLLWLNPGPVSYTHLTLPTIYSV